MPGTAVSSFDVEGFTTGYDDGSDRAILVLELEGDAGPIAFMIKLDHAEQIGAALSKIVQQRSSRPGRLC